MDRESLRSELAELRKKQHEAEQLEVFVGMTHSERAEYEARAKRINELEMERLASSGKEAPPSVLYYSGWGGFVGSVNLRAMD